MNKIKSYNEFVNEGLLSNLFSKIKGYLSQGLQELMKDVKSGDPEKMINSLKNYIQLNAKEMNKKLKEINTKSQLKEYLRNTLSGLYSAIKGIQSTQKIDPVYFEEMFKDADKNLVKLMNTKEKDFEPSLDQYLDQYLIPGLYKISGVKSKKQNESYLFENEAGSASADPASADPASADPASADPASADPASADTASADPASAGLKDDKKEENIPEEYRDKVIKSTKGWITNILSPILKIKNPDKKSSNSGDVISTSDKSEVKRDVVQDMVKNSSLDQIKSFRKMVGQSKGMNKDDWKNKWPVGK